MLTLDQRETILRRAGVVVPDFPPAVPTASAQEPAAGDMAAARREAIEQWSRTIETLYVEYVARRAAKGLRDAENQRQLSAIRGAGRRSTV